ncbi:MAG: adenosylcobinamide-GDP ribazoletransferase, partial [Chloroflexi bacterium]|nr:adenosylcobinamide-GDP ribazoletransferase [Chloroflexota bacterium]
MLAAIGFLTVLPLGTGRPGPWAVAAFPLAGLLSGAASAAVLLAAETVLPRSVAAVAALVALAAVTGGLHLDGLADTVDGLAGARDSEARLAIMRGGATGPLGA